MKFAHFCKGLRRWTLFKLFTVVTGSLLCSLWSQDQPQKPNDPRVPGKIPEHVLKDHALRYPSSNRPPVSRLGLSVEDVSAERQGLRVLLVVKDSPAERAKLKAGDVLEYFDDQLLIASKQLEILVKRSPVGTEAVLGLFRDGKFLEMTVILEAAQPAPPPSPELVSKDFAITQRIVRLTVGTAETGTTVVLKNEGQQAQLTVKAQDTVEFDGPVKDESGIPPHLRSSIQHVAKLENGRWSFHLPIQPPASDRLD